MQWTRLKSSLITFGVFAFPIFLAYWQIEVSDSQRPVRPHHKYRHQEKTLPGDWEPQVERAVQNEASPPVESAISTR